MMDALKGKKFEKIVLIIIVFLMAVGFIGLLAGASWGPFLVFVLFFVFLNQLKWYFRLDARLKQNKKKNIITRILYTELWDDWGAGEDVPEEVEDKEARRKRKQKQEERVHP